MFNEGEFKMKRVIFGILLLMGLVLGSQQPSVAITLTYLSGGVSAFTNIEDFYNHQYDQNYAHASAQLSGVGNAMASASAGATSLGGYYVSLGASAESSINNYYVGAQGFTTGLNESEDFIFLKVTASSGDMGNFGQLAYSSLYFNYINVPNWESFYDPFVITVNGIPKVNKYPPQSWNDVLDVYIGDIVGLKCNIIADNLSDTGQPLAGDMYANLYVSINPVGEAPAPVPLPPTVFLLGSGLLGLAGWRRFRKS